MMFEEALSLLRQDKKIRLSSWAIDEYIMTYYIIVPFSDKILSMVKMKGNTADGDGFNAKIHLAWLIGNNWEICDWEPSEEEKAENEKRTHSFLGVKDIMETAYAKDLYPFLKKGSE